MSGPLTVIEIGAEARRRGYNDLADWIIEEGVRREDAAKEALGRPFSTAAGTLEMGKHYNVTVAEVRYGTLQPRTLHLKDVVPTRVTGSVFLRYPKSGRRIYLYPNTQVLTIEEIS